MSVERIDTLIVGAGQAGIALSEHLGEQGIPYLVLEKSRIAEAWRTSRWDALMTNGPVWHDRFPNLEFKGNAPDEFVGKERVVAYIEEYADMVNAPVRSGVEVLSARTLYGPRRLLRLRQLKVSSRQRGSYRLRGHFSNL